MSLCVRQTNVITLVNGQTFYSSSPFLQAIDVQTGKECESIELSTVADYSQFTINPDLYSQVTGYILLSFVIGHVLGRILKTLGRG
ncbi:hypothetical protein [Vibrio casei]|uniref:hypothetical protein n=1 Tax=Vibrio casei TaxID=673372 RepID=UPI003F9E2E5B